MKILTSQLSSIYGPDMAPRANKREDIMSSDISFELGRLYDPYNFDHIPKDDDRLALFKQRDLPHIKHYKAAVKIFGGPHKRTRAIVAPPMETQLKHRLGIYFNRTEPPPSKVLNGPLKPPPEPVKELSKEQKELNAETEKTADYKKWMNERQKLRNDLNGLGLNEAMLARKPDKTEMEKRVQTKFKHDRTWKPESPPPKEETPPPQPAPDVPVMNVPPPDGLQILDKFLSLNRMRLLDLFKITDKDKSWSLSKEEFMNAVAQSTIPITEGEVNDMFIALDSDLDEELNFQELNQGLMQWRKQRRGLKKLSTDNTSQMTGPDSSTQTRPVSGSTTKAGSSQETRLSKKASKESVDKISTQGLSREDSGLSKSTKSSHVIKSSHSETAAETKGDKSTSIHDTMPKSRAKSNASSTKIPASETSVSKGGYETPRDTISDHQRPSSQQRVRIVDSSAPSDTQTESQDDRSLYDDSAYTSTNTPKMSNAYKESSGDDEEDSSKTIISAGKSTRTESRKIGTPTSEPRSRTSTPNSLEPPEFDTSWNDSRAPESEETLLEIRKHDRIVLSRNSIRRNMSRDKRVKFDELPGVIKIGYKPIDDHCADSTIGGEAAGMVEQFRREKLKEYYEIRRLFEEKGIVMNPKALDRVLLYPGDKTVHQMKKAVVQPLGPLTNEHNPFNQPKPKKKPNKQRRAFASQVNKRGGQGGSTRDAIGEARNIDDDGSGSASSKRSSITVEDVYPFAAQVAPKVYKENLSSGRALIARKVDNWMTFEEYTKYTVHLPHRFRHFNRPSNPDSVWPGYVLDKLCLCMSPHGKQVDGFGRALKNRDFVDYEGLGTGLYNGLGHAVFQNTSQRKLAYPGYNNDLNTWPIGPNGVIFGNIDEHRVVK